MGPARIFLSKSRFDNNRCILLRGARNTVLRPGSPVRSACSHAHCAAARTDRLTVTPSVWRWTVKYFNRRRVGILALCGLALVIGAAAVAVAHAQSARADSNKWPPQFPR